MGLSVRGKILIVASGMIILLMAWQIFSYVSELPIPFDQEIWLASKPPTGTPKRSGMAKDLIAKQVLLGKTRGEVESILGPADSRPDNSVLKMGYLLKEEYEWIGVDPVYSENLVLTFDHEWKVKQADINKWQR